MILTYFQTHALPYNVQNRLLNPLFKTLKTMSILEFQTFQKGIGTSAISDIINQQVWAELYNQIYG